MRRSGVQIPKAAPTSTLFRIRFAVWVVAGHALFAARLAAVAWVKPTDFAVYVPSGFAPDVERYLEHALASAE
jgi:hypothetical protein